jgi:predicted metal-dependent hydrolase
MSKFSTEITIGNERFTVAVEPDSRLRKSARWTLREQTIRVRVPRDMTRAEIDQILKKIHARITHRRNRAQTQSDDQLMERAMALNRRYFEGHLSWKSIRWVGNMKRRLGSCTNGGPTDGDIRISERICHWPAYVVDYVIAHEICHRKHTDHGEDFWNYLSRYPFVEKARGFIEGIGYAEHADPDSLLD